MHDDRGVIYVLTGKESLLPYVEQSAASLKRHMPEMRVTLFTDLDAALTSVDSVVRFPPGGDPKENKIAHMAGSPYRDTLFLDVDTYVCEDLNELFTLLDQFDLAATHAPVHLEAVSENIPPSFTQLNSGVVLYRRGAAIERLFRDWLAHYRRMRGEKPRIMDQPAFRTAVYYNRDVRVATLPTEYNCRLWIGGFLNETVKILHAYATPEEFERFARLANTAVQSHDYLGRGRAVVLNGDVFRFHEGRVEKIGAVPLPVGRKQELGLKRPTPTAGGHIAGIRLPDWVRRAIGRAKP